MCFNNSEIVLYCQCLRLSLVQVGERNGDVKFLLKKPRLCFSQQNMFRFCQKPFSAVTEYNILEVFLVLGSCKKLHKYLTTVSFKGEEY